MPRYLKNNCTSGELTPYLDRRTDTDQVKNGLATCLNAEVSPYGGVRRRFGSAFVAEAKHEDKLCILKDFVFSEDVAYVLEIGEEYIRFYTDHAQVVSGVTPVEVSTDYQEDELRDLRFETSADVVYAFHKDHPPGKLTRVTASSWTFVDIPFTGGPFLAKTEAQEDITLTASAVTGSAVTITASASLFVAGHVDSLWKLSSGKETSIVTGSYSGTNAYAALTVYAEDAYVTYSGATYKSKHPSYFTSPDRWLTGTTYAKHHIVRYDPSDTTYRSTVDANQGNDPQVSHWDVVTGNIGNQPDLFPDWWEEVEGAASDNVYTANEIVEVEISGTWVGRVIIERSFNGGDDWYAFQQTVENIDTQLSDTRDILYRLTFDYTSGTITYRLSTLDSEANGMGTFRVTTVNSATQVTAEVVEELRATTATTIWNEPEWSGVYGYPRVGKVYEGRLFLGSTESDPLKLWYTTSLEYETMIEGSIDSDAGSFVLNAKGGVDPFKWMVAWNQLIVGTSGGEIRVQSNDGISVSSPPTIKQDSDFGSANIEAFVAGKAILFVDKSKRSLRAYQYNYNTNTFDSDNDLALFSAHIIDNGEGIVDVAYQQNPYQIIWCVLEDGTKGALTFKPEQNIVGWHRHESAESSGIMGEYESITVIPVSAGYDEIWTSVKRAINLGAAGEKVTRYIEYRKESEYDFLGAVPTPVFSLATGMVKTASVEITCSEDEATIHYTIESTMTDGTSVQPDDPTKYSSIYTGALTLTDTTVPIIIKAIAFHPYYSESAIASATYVYNPNNEIKIGYSTIGSLVDLIG